ncbi:AAEL007625-PA [Aedes aegypti]|uniref:AAEL007625-PA n=1 Tax=Aedes aegypti TaxID=7159 RepID=Q171I7_AEDAE|nr:AAEL007625-PA [Aedes aegypti]
MLVDTCCLAPTLKISEQRERAHDRGTCCPVCKRQGLQFVEICNTMDKKFKALFDPDVPKTIEQSCKIINFQTKQKQHLIDYIIYMDEKILKAEQIEHHLKKKVYELQQCYQKTRNYRRNKQQALRKQMGLAEADEGESPPTGANPPTRNEGDFFDDHTKSSGSNGSRLSTDSRGRKDSFLNLKGSSTSSDSVRSVDFGTTPSSGDRSTGRINESFHSMRIDSE